MDFNTHFPITTECLKTEVILNMVDSLSVLKISLCLLKVFNLFNRKLIIHSVFSHVEQTKHCCMHCAQSKLSLMGSHFFNLFKIILNYILRRFFIDDVVVLHKVMEKSYEHYNKIKM